MTSFSKYFGINKSQAELDFVDIDISEDTPLYIDPYALTTREDEWSLNSHELVVSYFEEILLSIKNNNLRRGLILLTHLNEPEETRLGVSESGNKGRGIGSEQAKDIFNALKNSKASKSGLLEDLSDIALFIPQVGRDKISDMTTNIIRFPLIKYTQVQCQLYNIPMQNVPSGFYWSKDKKEWLQSYELLPVCDGSKVILVPKFAVRYQVGVDHAVYRSKFVLEYLKEEHNKPGDALLTAIRDKKGKVIKEVVYKKDVDKKYPKDKDFLAEFSANHPKVIDSYRDYLKTNSSKIPNISRDTVNELNLSKYLIEQLSHIVGGKETASKYHNLMIGIISFIFFPNLIYPQKEAEINEGRKRLDILYTNGKNNGFFYRIALDSSIKANFIHVECKNYTKEIANPEFDQLIARFDNNRGRFGMLFFRESEDMNTVIKRCQDAAKSGQGIVLPIDDSFVIKCLNLIASKNRNQIDQELDSLYRQICS